MRQYNRNLLVEGEGNNCVYLVVQSDSSDTSNEIQIFTSEQVHTEVFTFKGTLTELVQALDYEQRARDNGWNEPA